VPRVGSQFTRALSSSKPLSAYSASASLSQPFAPEFAQAKHGVVNVASHSDIQFSHLPNGLKVVTLKADNGNVDINMRVDLEGVEVGDIERSVGTLLKSFFLKETKNVDSNSVYRLIKTELGADYKVIVNRNSISYHLSCLKQDYPRALAYLAEFFAHASPNLAELKEIEAVMEKKRDVTEKTIKEMMEELVHQSAISSSSSSSSSASSFLLPPALLLSRHHQPNKTVVCAAGVDHQEFVTLVSQFEAPPITASSSTSSSSPSSSSPTFQAGDVRVHRSEMNSAMAALTFKAPGLSHKDFLAAELVGFCVGAKMTPYADFSLFSVASAGASDKVYPSLLKKLAKARNPLTQAEFEKGKEKFIAAFVKTVESRSMLLAMTAIWASVNKPVSLADQLNIIRKLSYDDVCAVAESIFGQNAPAFAAHGNLLSFPRYDQIVKEAQLKL